MWCRLLFASNALGDLKERAGTSIIKVMWYAVSEQESFSYTDLRVTYLLNIIYATS